MRLVLLGAPGVGKGTQAVRISRLLNVPHISTGEIFRENIKKNTPLGIKANEYIKSGKLVPDSITEEMVRNRLEESDCERGFVLDGFPRTVGQAEFLEEHMNRKNMGLDAAIELTAKREVILERLGGRRVCPNCGENYHLKNKRPVQEGICDKCSTALVQRPDDTPETINQRLEVYEMETRPLIDFYEKRGLLIRIDANGELEEVSDNIIKALGVAND